MCVSYEYIVYEYHIHWICIFYTQDLHVIYTVYLNIVSICTGYVFWYIATMHIHHNTITCAYKRLIYVYCILYKYIIYSHYSISMYILFIIIYVFYLLLYVYIYMSRLCSNLPIKEPSSQHCSMHWFQHQIHRGKSFQPATSVKSNLDTGLETAEEAIKMDEFDKHPWII